MLKEKHVGEVWGDLTIVAASNKPANGYLYYYWTKCKCGNIKRYRYDQLRKVGNCGQCEDFIESEVNAALEGFSNGKE